ncbi:hypothetical protein D3C81_1921120 [compost metagenome]
MVLPCSFIIRVPVVPMLVIRSLAADPLYTGDVPPIPVVPEAVDAYPTPSRLMDNTVPQARLVISLFKCATPLCGLSLIISPCGV